MGKIILLICLANTGGARNVSSIVTFNTMQECQESLKLTKLETSPVRETGNTWMGFATCGYMPKLKSQESLCSNYSGEDNGK